ncbi:MAG: hypothetical protein PHY30_02400 [Candidatus Pacebacteria bacterium]|nr:hypothetical protein [Candidatus Paceibacterota bacterium]
MFKKAIISLLISLILLTSINVYASSSNEEERGIASEFIEVIFNGTLLGTVKENIAVHYNKMYAWFKENIEPKIEDIFDKVKASEEYSKEKEELKGELPSIFEKICDLFHSLTEKEN